MLVRIREGVEWLWELPDGEITHLTGAGLPSYGVSRIGPVYTPKEHRGRGIASYVVGELTRRGLEAGHRMCLFTDQATPRPTRSTPDWAIGRWSTWPNTSSWCDLRPGLDSAGDD